jgi:hypothetical protein
MHNEHYYDMWETADELKDLDEARKKYESITIDTEPIMEPIDPKNKKFTNMLGEVTKTVPVTWYYNEPSNAHKDAADAIAFMYKLVLKSMGTPKDILGFPLPPGTYSIPVMHEYKDEYGNIKYV